MVDLIIFGIFFFTCFSYVYILGRYCRSFFLWQFEQCSHQSKSEGCLSHILSFLIHLPVLPVSSSSIGWHPTRLDKRLERANFQKRERRMTETWTVDLNRFDEALTKRTLTYDYHLSYVLRNQKKTRDTAFFIYQKTSPV